MIDGNILTKHRGVSCLIDPIFRSNVEWTGREASFCCIVFVMKNVAMKLVVSVFISVLVIGLLALMVKQSGENITPAVVFATIRQAVVPLVILYGICQLVQTVLRAIRNRIVLRAGMPDDRKDSVPSLGHIMLVTFVRGACADMLPARIGELSYVAMLNRGYHIPVSDCLTSLSIGLVFDFSALLIVLGVALTTIAQGLSLLGSAIVLVVVCLIGWAGLFYMMPWMANVLAVRSPPALMRWRPYAWFVKLMVDMSESVRFVASSGTVIPVLGISAAIRFVKYFGLYFLFIAVTQQTWPKLAAASVPQVLVALISSEGAASLPVPSFMSFGSYEAGGLVALTALGFGMAASMAAMLTMHIISQTIDYTLGGVAFCAFMWIPRGEAQASEPRRLRRLRGVGMFLPLAAVFLAVVGVLSYSAARRGGEACTDSAFLPIGEALTERKMDGQIRSGMRGRIVWSSNRRGTHDLYMYTFPSGKMKQMTASGFTDTYPRFSADGRKVAFSRSQLPYVSQRNALKWDTWVLDLDSGQEIRMATNAFTATWHPDGESLVYVRNGDQVVKQKAEPGASETVLLATGTRKIPGGTEFQTPHVGGDEKALAVTLRRHHIGTWVFWPDGTQRRVGGGCQVMWTGLSQDRMPEILWVDAPGRLKHAFYGAVAREGKRQLIFDPASEWSHEYFPQTAQVDKELWLVYGASTGGHEHDQADYEIFLWRIGSSEMPLRITWHTGNDCWPDLFID